MEFRILGSLEVRDDGREVVLGGARQRALLALLVLHANEAVATERLIDELWGERPPPTATKTVQVNISRLRKALERSPAQRRPEVIVTREHGYELRLDPERIDALRFERLIVEGRRELAKQRPERALSLLDEALGLWRGRPLAEFAFERFARAEGMRLEELRVGALEELIETKLALGRHTEVVGALERLIPDNPYRERLRAQLMLALYRCDRQADALQAYQDARRKLVEELGIEPGKRLRELEQAILAQDPGLAFIEREAAAVQPAPDAPRGAFVGRERELTALTAGLDEVCAGRGRLLLLTGEPGIGKSRLAEELIVCAEQRGALVLVGRCWEAGGAPAYWPWVQSLRTYVRERDSAALRSELAGGASDLAQVIPELRERFPDLGDPPALDPDGARFRLFDGAAEFLRNASKRRALVIVLDDVHAADAPSLLLLRFLARELGSMRVLILVAYRNVDPIPGEPLAEVISEVTREPVTHRITLGGLTEREVEQYLRLTAAETASAALVTTLHAETEGNPLFVGEIVRLLCSEGASPASGDARLMIPQTVHDVIGRRLARLSPECGRLLALASLLGREFDLDSLARLAEIALDELLDTLEEAIAARVLGEVPGAADRLRFAHVLMRDTLYDGLTRTRRVHLHRRVLQTLERLYGARTGPQLAELAHHAVAARDFGKAVHYAWRAADQSLALLAYEEAARLYQIALDALESADHASAVVSDGTDPATRVAKTQAEDAVYLPDHDQVATQGTLAPRALEPAPPAFPHERCELLLALGEAQSRGADPAAPDTFSAAAEAARSVADPELLGRAALGRCGVGVTITQVNPDRTELLHEAIDLLDQRSPALRAQLLARLAIELYYDPGRERSDPLSAEAVQIARTAAEPDALLAALNARHVALWTPDGLNERLAVAEEMVAFSRAHDRPEQELQGRNWLCADLWEAGRLGEFEVAIGEHACLASELRLATFRWYGPLWQGALAALHGDWSAAEENITAAEAQGNQAGDPNANMFAWGMRLSIRCARGEFPADDLETIEQYVKRSPASTAWRCIRCWYLAEQRRLDEARDDLEWLAADNFRRLPRDANWLVAVFELAQATSILHDTNRAHLLFEMMLPYRDRHISAMRGCTSWGSAESALGLLAQTAGRSGDAAAHYEAALIEEQRWGARAWQVHTRSRYAMLLAHGSAPADKAAARNLAREAISEATALDFAASTMPANLHDLASANRSRAPSRTDRIPGASRGRDGRGSFA